MSNWTIANLILILPLLGIVAVILILVLIGKRVQEKREETFEKRDN